MANLKKKKVGNEVCGAVYKRRRCYCKCESVAGIWGRLEYSPCSKSILYFC
jgi:hypothetical protein